MPGLALPATARFCALLLLALCPGAGAGTWATGSAMEVDRCASAWLISRQVDPQATFAFVADNEPPPQGSTGFDLPVAALRRDHRQSTYEAILAKYAITDGKALHLGRLVHQIEINFFAQHEDEARKLETDLRTIFHDNPDLQTCLDHCQQYLDDYTIPTTKETP